MIYRTGLGFDIHKLDKNLKLIIGGVTIPSDLGSVAHSDGDVLLHAITDALLGAAGLSDIGELFPPEDNTWKNADSKMLLSNAWELIKTHNWKIENLDCVVILEKPKLIPYRDSIIKSISEILFIEQNQVFVKAKTSEGLGNIGNSKAIASIATCLLYK